MQTISTDSIAQLNTNKGFHWFEPGSMRFFRSRVASVAYISADGTKAYFVSSEKRTGFRCEDGRRLYSVRVASLESGDVDTFPDHNAFQAYASRSGADAAAQRAAQR